MSGRRVLPRLPVPALGETCQRYLETLEPYFAGAAEREEARRDVAAFLADPDVRERQAKLEQLYEREDSWLANMWTRGAYMQWRAALPINSNVTGYLFGENRTRFDQSFGAAALAHGALQFHLELLNNGLAPAPDGSEQDQSQCMDQYSRMFSLTRVPGEEEDHQVKFSEEESRHLVVIAGRHLYTMPVIGEDRALIPLPLLHAGILQIHADARQRGPDPVPIAALTGTDRTTWAKVRNDLMLRDELNSKSLRAVETAIFAISLEDGVDATDEDCGKSCFHGDGNTSWFDKSFQLKVKEDGNASINIEHSWADAPVPLDMFFTRALPYAEALDETECIKSANAALLTTRPSQWPAPTLLEWNKTDNVRAAVEHAQAQLSEAIADSDVSVYRCRGLGKPVWKQAKISPDAAIQMAMQLAFRRLAADPASGPVATYETIGMRQWRMGRTETCRVVSKHSEAFVRTVIDGWLQDRSEAKRQEAEAALRAACKAHIDYIVRGQQGGGVDRHFFGLRMLSPDGSQPDLFKHRLFADSGSTGCFVLSSSNNSYIARPFGGLFGAVMPNGYGICYIPRADEITLCVESKHSCPETDSRRFSEMIEQCLRDIATIAGVPDLSGASKL